MRPVILIPGIGGSIIVPKGHEYRRMFHTMVPNNRWIHLYAFTQKEINQWKKDMGHDYLFDEYGKITGIVPHRHIVPLDIGGTKGVRDIVPEFLWMPEKYQEIIEELFHSRYFGYICDHLHKKGYKDHYDLFGIPYDFRMILDPNIRHLMFQDMKKSIEEGCYNTGKSAVIITHSLGGILLKWFLTTEVTHEWTKEHIKRWICISAPFGGSQSALKGATSGEHYVPALRPYVKDELQRITGIVMCLPNRLAFDPNQTLATIADHKVTIRDYDKFAEQGVIPFKLWKDLYEPHLPIMEARVSVPTDIVIAKDVPTLGAFYSKSWNDPPYSKFQCTGDGMVPSHSLQAFEKILDHKHVKEVTLPNTDHTLLLSNPSVWHIIKSYIH